MIYSHYHMLSTYMVYLYEVEFLSSIFRAQYCIITLHAILIRFSLSYQVQGRAGQGRAQGRRSTLNMEPRFHEAGKRAPLYNDQSVSTSDNSAEIGHGELAKPKKASIKNCQRQPNQFNQRITRDPGRSGMPIPDRIRCPFRLVVDLQERNDRSAVWHLLLQTLDQRSRFLTFSL